MSIETYDVCIVGGGPAGSTTASYLAKAGLRCLVLEGERFPRRHVGECWYPGRRWRWTRSGPWTRLIGLGSHASTAPRKMRNATQWWRNFIVVYYRLNVLFSSYIRDPEYRLDLIRLLQGAFFDDDTEPPVLGKMREKLQLVEGNPHHPWHASLRSLQPQTWRDPAAASG